MEDVKTLGERIEALAAKIADLQSDIDGFDVSEHAAEHEYDEWLDEMGPIEVCGMQYDASDVLKSVDPIAYRCGFADYCDSLDPSDFDAYTDLADELADMEDELSDLEDERDALDDE